ncbi:MAG: [Fe-Fe] hydrogenase large subunit C-terminal domain-containing protein [Acidobacteriota bacterium]
MKIDHFYHALRLEPENCSGKLKCMNACPTNAIRYRKQRAVLLNDLCIDCGVCIEVCPDNAFIPVIDSINDFKNKKYLVAIPSSVLYYQLGPDVTPPIIHKALKEIGFDCVYDISDFSEEIALASIQNLNENLDRKPMLSSFCPTVVRLIQVNYPNLVKLLEPVNVPREILAMTLRDKLPEELGVDKKDIGIIYITPCPAMTVSIKQPAEKGISQIDGAVTIKEIYNMILPLILNYQKSGDMEKEEDSHFGKGWGVLGHIARDLGENRCLAVAGLKHIKKILDDIENSKLRDIDFIEALACDQGCLGGLFCVTNPYIAKHNSILMEKKAKPITPVKPEVVINKYKEGFYLLDSPILPRPTRSSDKDLALSVKRIKQKERILQKLPHKDCCLCGAPTCETFAEDCAYGEADLTDCIFFSE